MDNHPELKNSIITDFAEAYSNFGLNPLMGRIIALLIISKDPQSLDDITEKLEMSKGPISQICRRLKERNLIESVWVPGDRKDYYKATEDIFGQAFQNQKSKMSRNIQIAKKYADIANDMDGDEERYAYRKMREMQSFYELMDQHNEQFLKAWKNKLSELRN